MNKFSVIAIIVTVIILAGGVLLLSKGQRESSNYPPPENLTYYWGNGCPHCKIVEDFMSTWDKKDAVKIDKKEVWYNTANAKELEARYASCGVPKTEMGVPFLYTPEGKCFSGDTPIIDYLKTLK